MVASLLLAGWAAATTCLAAPEPPLSVRQEPVRCMLAERYPQIDACIEPAQRVARARVYFRAEQSGTWHYVEMKPVGTCYRGTLPPPQPASRRVRYYLVATDVIAGDSATPEVAAAVVTDEKSCPAGTAVGPFLSAAAVDVGGGGAPAGFVAAASHGPGLKVIGAVVGGGAIAAGALLAHGSGSGGTGATGATDTTTLPTTTTTTTTTTTRPPKRTTTTTTTRPPATTTTSTSTTTSTTSTTTTTLASCASDSAPPTVSFQQPKKNADVGTKVPITVQASDPGPASSGMSSVRLFAQRVGGTSVVGIVTLTGPGPSYTASWTMPACGPDGAAGKEQWDISAEATDKCGRASTATVRVRRTAASCKAATTLSRTLVFASELGVAGGRGQVVANGRDAVFPPAGHSELLLAPRAGENRVEAVLVDARGSGSWRFSLAAGGIRPGTLRVLAGDVAAVGADSVTFRLRGRPGERVVFSFEAEVSAPDYIND